MKKFLSLFSAILFAVSMMAGVGNVYYTATFLKGTSAEGNNVSGYDMTGNYTSNGITWTIPGNNTNGDYIRIGGKSITEVDRSIISQSPLGDAIAKIVISHNGKSRASIVLHSVTVVVASDADFTENVVSEVYTPAEGEIAKNTAGEIVITPEADKWEKDSYYKIVLNLSNPDDKNGGIDVQSMAFYSYQDASVPAINTSNINLGLVASTVLPISREVELEVVGANLTEAITYAVTGDHTSVTGTLTKDGGTLTVTITADADAEVDDVITLTSGSTTAEVSVKASIIKTDGDGSKDAPFSVADVVKMSNRYGNEKAWVIGYVVGCAANGGVLATTDVATNIALGTSMDQTENLVPVQLPSGSVRTALNVVDNDTKGAQVKVYGQLMSYFSFYGLQNVTDYEILSAAPIVDTYTVAGSSSPLFGASWDWTLAANDMTLDAVSGLYVWEKSDVELSAENIEFKVFKNHATEEAWPESNWVINTISESGIYTVKITFNADTKEITAEATKTGDAVVVPTMSVKGEWDTWNLHELAKASDNLTAEVIVTIAAGEYEFGLDKNGTFIANGVTIDRDNASVEGLEGNTGNMKLVADVDGDYTFTWTYETNKLDVTFPAKPDPIDPSAANFVKVTTAPADWSGDYLIVYETGSLAFNGGLETLDAVGNTIEVTIADNKIAATTTTLAAKVTLAKEGEGYSVKSASGKYIGVSSYGNGLKQGDAPYVHDVPSLDADGNAILSLSNTDWDGTMIMNYNASSGQTRFRYYKNGNQKAIQLYKLESGETPEPVDTYTVAGSSAPLFGASWDWTLEANDMTLDAVSGLYVWEKSDVELSAENIEFKVFKNHATEEAWPESNWVINTITESGIYTVKITFNADTKEITAEATKTGDAVVVPTMSVKGEWDTWTLHELAKASDNLTAEVIVTIAAGEYEFGLDKNGTFIANGATIDRDNASVEGLEGNTGNMKLVADVDGDYTFTWTYETNKLVVTFPAKPDPIDPSVTSYTLTFNGTGTSSDASANIAATVEAIFTEDCQTYVESVEDATKVYAARVIAENSSSLKFGTTSVKGNLSFTLANPSEMDSIVVNATQYGDKESEVTVNGTAFALTAGNKVPQDCKFIPEEEVSTITIAQSTSERIYLRSVTLYPKAGSTEPTPAIKANGVDFGEVKIEASETAYVVDKEIEVTGKYLTEEITATASSAAITIANSPLPAAGGTLQLHIEAPVGAFSETITLTSGEVSKEIAITGTVNQKAAPLAGDFDTIYVWNGKRGEETATEAIEQGGTAAAYGGNTNIVVGTAQKTNWTMKLNKGFANEFFVGITLDQALAKGDKLQVAAFRTSETSAILGIDFSESEEAASTACQILHDDDLQVITTNVAPEDEIFDIPDAAEGAKFIRIYRNSGSTGIYVANFSIYREKSTPVEHTYTVAGVAALVGEEWNPAATANDMTKQADGTYQLVKENVTLNKATEYEYKVAIDHAWGNGEAGENSKLIVEKDGRYNVTFTYDPVAPTTSAVAELIEEIVIDPTAKIMGTLAQNGWDGDDLTLSSDKKSASITLTLVAGNYEFKMFINGSYRGMDGEGSTPYVFHRDWTEQGGITGNSVNNMVLSADVEGDYKVTWTFDNDSIAFTFPAKSDPTAIDNAELGEQAVKMLKDNQVVIIKGDKTFNIVGQRIR